MTRSTKEPETIRAKARELIAAVIAPRATASGCIFRTNSPDVRGLCAEEILLLEEDSTGNSHRVAFHQWWE